LILTSFDSPEHPALMEKLEARGITKHIAYEVSADKVKKLYGWLFSIILGDLSQTDDLRVMDIDGHHVFNSFSFDEPGPPIYYQPKRKTVKTAQAAKEPLKHEMCGPEPFNSYWPASYCTSPED